MKILVIGLATAVILMALIVSAQAQRNPLHDCELARDTARTRVTVVTNSRAMMEEDLAAMSVTVRREREQIQRLQAEITRLQNQIRLAKEKSEADKTKSSEGETKTEEAETEPVRPETKPAKTETPAEELNQ